MKKKLFLFLYLLLIQASSFAAREIPQVTIFTQNSQNYYNNYSIIDSQDQNQVQVIPKKEITKSGSLTLVDVVNNKDGIQTMQMNEGRTTISMRGFGDNGSNNALILLNGQPFLNSDMGNLIINNLPLNDIEQIEILPTSNSILYGDQAVGGVVNIITNTPQKKSYKATLATGNYATYLAGANISDITKNGIGYHLGVSTYSSNNYRYNNAERLNNIVFDLTYKDTYLSYYKINQHLELPGGLTWKQVIQNPRQAYNNTDYNNQNHDILQLGTKHNLTSNWILDLDGNFKNMSGTGLYSPYFFTEKRRVITINPKALGVINLKKYSILPTIGTDLGYSQYERNTDKASQNHGTIYGQFVLPITSKVSTTLGSRYAQAFYRISSSTIDTLIKPINRAWVNSLELSWQTLDNLNLFIKGAENYRFPKTDEASFTVDNSPLKTQTGTSYEMGSKLKYKNLSSSLTAYRLNLKNEIAFVPQLPSQYHGYNENLDSTRRDGIILDFNFLLTKYLEINGNYSFVNAKFIDGEFTDKEIPFVAKNNYRLAAIFKPLRNLHFLAEAVYTGKRYLINDIENRAGQLGGFTIYNLGISFEDRHYILTIRGNNLTNKIYYGYATAIYNGNNTAETFYPAAGFNLLATLSVKL
jgi:iron complex outermembrane receptor protein